MDFARRLVRQEGALAGFSSGEALAVAARIAQEGAFASKTIVMMLTDYSERSFSSELLEGALNAKDKMP